ncbi:N-acetyltransferase family protein [Streptomyces sp. FXJ1.172]|uniref:GNAT family N-acetyltransferase n=1 Tax=Streptomyces sp. FXJ1.172 TaxID=710705 RepID=UPI0007CF8BD4|nr:GNAT family N-acetyltransferase [Streptomyces sp. FXJ1.172]WEO99646.1 GNAT family N-acetyltransferase [Streptomyces sp. FXJ1.172]
MTAVPATVRTATASDLKAVADIYTHYVRHSVATFEEIPPTVAHWKQRLDDLSGRKLPFLVAESDGAVTGFAHASPWRPKPAYRNTVEDTIYLAPDATGLGLGTALLEAVITESARAGMRQMIAVIADTGSEASRALHRRFGFTDAGHLVGVGHKHGRWIDTFLMQRTLTAGHDPQVR